MGDKFGLTKALKKWQSERKTVLEELGKEALKFTLDNYDKEGFENTSFQKWKPKKYPNGQKTLVDTGLLKKSFKLSVTQNKAVISNDVFYGIFHNEGTSKLPQRKFLGNSRVLELANANRIIKHIHRIFF